MLSIFRWSLRITVAIILLFLLIIISSYFLTKRSIPNYNADYQLKGLRDELNIIRDSFNVPHIISENDNDAFFGLGFVHAQDRLWQMALLRRASKGRLSEIFGKDTIASDILFRELGIYSNARKSLEIQDSDTISALVAYSNGVNEWINTVNSKAMGRGAPEFFLFSKDMDLWKPEDSLAIINLMAFRLTSAYQEELIRALASKKLTSLQYNSIFNIKSNMSKNLTNEINQSSVINNGYHDKGQKGTLTFSELQNRSLKGASNVFAVSSDRAALKYPLLANDPHLKLSSPSTWYLARLNLKSGAVIGATIPGIPTILSGRSETTAWGITSAYVDDQDLYFEKLNPTDRNQYKTEKGFVDFEVRHEELHIKNSPSQKLIIRKSQNGPILTSEHINIKSITPDGHVVAMRWTAMSEKNTSLQAAIRIMRSSSLTEIIASGAGYFAPAQNLLAADKGGIALKTIGKIPRRSVNHETSAQIPSKGWKIENRWMDFIPYQSNPEINSPKDGIIYNTNNRLVNKTFPDHISYDYGDTQRHLRIKKLLNNRSRHTLDSFIEYQQDIISSTAQTILPVVASNLWTKLSTQNENNFSLPEETALRLLLNWNGEMSKYLPEPLIYTAWMRNLQKETIQDELKELTSYFNKFDPDFIKRVFLSDKKSHAWCDMIYTEGLESCEMIAEISFKKTIKELSEVHGDRPDLWQWGSVHQAMHRHSALGNVPILDIIFNIKHPSSGGENTIQR
ncbi:MAG: penicillin acylase family protein, partial [Paracoccaceae bacterium]